jgi:hypothetical protein
LLILNFLPRLSDSPICCEIKGVVLHYEDRLTGFLLEFASHKSLFLKILMLTFSMSSCSSSFSFRILIIYLAFFNLISPIFCFILNLSFWSGSLWIFSFPYLVAKGYLAIYTSEIISSCLCLSITGRWGTDWALCYLVCAPPITDIFNEYYYISIIIS